MSMRRKITRKEIAHLVGVSTDSVARNEETWGLTRSKVEANKRLIWYREDEAMQALRDKHLVE